MNIKREFEGRRRQIFRQDRLLGQPVTCQRVGRRLGLEALEDRRLLAVFSVSNLSDSGTGSLRDAIAMANSAPGADELQFAVTGSIGLTSGQLEITETLTITGPGQDLLTIDAQQNSRIFYNSADAADLAISGLTLTGGRTAASGATGRGGAIRSGGLGTLTIDQSTITGNGTTGTSADGGAIRTGGDVVLNSSVVSGNTTASDFARGGAIYAYGSVMVTQSTVSGNSTAGNNAPGGAIRSFGDVTLIGSTLSGNSTAGRFSAGGAVLSVDHVTLTSSTVSGNSTAGSFGYGGGIASFGDMTLTDSTITDNHATHPSASGGGIWNLNDLIQITNSIVADNSAGSGVDDISPGDGPLIIDFSLIGVADGLTIMGNMGNQTGTSAAPLDPLLAPLASNGGATATHSLQPGSPAIDAGGSLTMAANFDQRGTPFVRLFDDPVAPGAGIDIGALELQPSTQPMTSADFDEDGDVDGADFLAWQRGFGTPTPSAAKSDGDADNDLDVDDVDLGFWEAAFGNGVPPITALAAASSLRSAMAMQSAAMQSAAMQSAAMQSAAMQSAEPVDPTYLTHANLTDAAHALNAEWLGTGSNKAAAYMANSTGANFTGAGTSGAGTSGAGTAGAGLASAGTASALSNATDRQAASPAAVTALEPPKANGPKPPAAAASQNEPWLTDELLQRVFG